MTSPRHFVPPAATAAARSSGRFPFAFGRRFFLALVVGLVWAGPAWWEPRYLLGMVAWDLLVLGAWLWDLGRLPAPGALTVTRSWNAPVALADESRVTLELRNDSKLPLLVSLRDDVPVTLRAEAPLLETAVAAGAAARLEYPVRPSERGNAELGGVFLRYRSFWQLAERWAAAALPQTVRVYPDLEEARRGALFLIRSRQRVMEKRVKHFRGQGREFESLREYRPGDEYRSICWTATARRGKPISKVFQVERSQTVWLLLDAGRLLRARSAGRSKLDYATAAALSLAQVALHSGDTVGLLAYGRRPQQRVPPGRGPEQLRALMEGLAQVHGEAVEANHPLAAESLLSLQKRRSLVVWLTDLAETATTPEVVESAARMAHRHLVFLAVIGQPEMRALLETDPANARQMYRYAAAQEIVQRRDLLLRGLRRHGALALEIDPTRLSTAVVNQYLEAKERSLL
jgi:uncharacterized protein (DUF58 family)